MVLDLGRVTVDVEISWPARPDLMADSLFCGEIASLLCRRRERSGSDRNLKRLIA
jgi:hypothetical protein